MSVHSLTSMNVMPSIHNLAKQLMYMGLKHCIKLAISDKIILGAKTGPGNDFVIFEFSFFLHLT